jgi:hypothetical protein
VTDLVRARPRAGEGGDEEIVRREESGLVMSARRREVVVEGRSVVDKWGADVAIVAPWRRVGGGGGGDLCGLG